MRNLPRFSHSTLRQQSYNQLYETINVGEVPLKILQLSDTRWLRYLNRVLDQYEKLTSTSSRLKTRTETTVWRFQSQQTLLTVPSAHRPRGKPSEQDVSAGKYKSMQAFPTSLSKSIWACYEVSQKSAPWWWTWQLQVVRDHLLWRGHQNQPAASLSSRWSRKMHICPHQQQRTSKQQRCKEYLLEFSIQFNLIYCYIVSNHNRSYLETLFIIEQV